MKEAALKIHSNFLFEDVDRKNLKKKQPDIQKQNPGLKRGWRRMEDSKQDCLCDGDWWEKVPHTPGPLSTHPNNQSISIKQAEWTPFWALIFLLTDWDGHNTSLTSSLLFTVYIFPLQLQGIELFFFLYTLKAYTQACLVAYHNQVHHKDNWELLDQGEKEESWPSSTNDFIFILWQICQL